MTGKKKNNSAKREQAPKPGQAAASAPEWTDRHTQTALIFILAGSFFLGMAAVIQFTKSPFFILPIIDEEAYVRWAIEIASGDFLGKKVFYQDPLYPYFLAALFKIFGSPEIGEPHRSWFLVRLVQVLVGTGSVYLVHFTAARLIGSRRALVAAAMLALYGGLYYFEILLLKATLVIFFSAFSCAVGVWASEKPRAIPRFGLVGFSLGLLTLLRGNFLAIIPFLAAWSMFAFWREGWKSSLLRGAAFLAGVLLVLVPVTLRNYVVGGEMVLTTSQGGANFYIGNNEAANGRYVTLPFVRANPQWEAADFQREAEKRAGRKLSPSGVSRFWFEESFKWIKENPERAVKLTFLKVRLLLHRHEIPDNHSFYLTRNEFVSVLWLTFMGFGLLFALALVGMAVAAGNRAAWYPALFMLLYALSIVPFFIVARYRLAVTPAAAVFAAIAVSCGVNYWRKKDGKLFTGAAALAVLLIPAFWPTPVSRAPMGLEYYLLANGYLKTGQPEKSIPWYDLAQKALPENADVAKNRAEAMRRINEPQLDSMAARIKSADTTAVELVELGRAAESKGQIALAVEAYTRAAGKSPDNYSAHARLGFLLATRPEVKNLEGALFHAEQALKIKPDDLDTMNALGNINLLAGNTVRARYWYQQILARVPDHAQAQQNLSVIEKDNYPGPAPPPLDGSTVR